MKLSSMKFRRSEEALGRNELLSVVHFPTYLCSQLEGFLVGARSASMRFVLFVVDAIEFREGKAKRLPATFIPRCDVYAATREAFLDEIAIGFCVDLNIVAWEIGDDDDVRLGVDCAGKASPFEGNEYPPVLQM